MTDPISVPDTSTDTASLDREFVKIRLDDETWTMTVREFIDIVKAHRAGNPKPVITVVVDVAAICAALAPHYDAPYTRAVLETIVRTLDAATNLNAIKP